MRARGGLGTGLAVFVVLALLAFGACLAIADDDDDQDGLKSLAGPQTAAQGPLGRRDECRRECQRSGDGDRKGNRYCVMPCDFVIIVPMPGQQDGPPPDEEAALPSNLDPRCAPFHCDPKPASLMPPDPVKLMEAIKTFTQGVGEASGALAGAIAGGTIGILL